jgi:hypothetical protein
MKPTLKKILGLLSAIAVVGAIGTANSAEIVGKVMDVNPYKDFITLDNNRRYKVDAAVNLDMLKKGDTIAAYFRHDLDDVVLTDVMVTRSSPGPAVRPGATPARTGIQDQAGKAKARAGRGEVQGPYQRQDP